ncbi:alpha/beta fold hydrolase [Streptomyces sp. NPDC127106]|uniref:alpha/beta fold hydrolase n=1 Tax=Streptomyces sp. NPDC127106 TaxID=3345360 RepID=UPI00364253D5
MGNFVLVPGAWLGAWAWDAVAAELRAAGHDAHALTLSGLAERHGAASWAGQQTHVYDIVDAVERLDLRDVVLVGHSYSGIPVGQAAELIGDRLARVVFVDADVPVDGESFVSGWPGGVEVAAAIEANGGLWPALTAADCAGQDLDEEQIARFVAGATPHPGAALTEPAALARPLGELPAVYVKCLLDGPEPPPAAAELLKNDSWSLLTLDTGHWPMFSRPAELAGMLAGLSSGTGGMHPGGAGDPSGPRR